MAAILIYDYDSSITRRLRESLHRANHWVSVCRAGGKIPVEPDKTPLVILDARMKWTACRPLFEQFQRQGCPVLFITGDRSMTGHLRAMYAGPSDVLTLPFAPNTLLAKVSELLGTGRELRELSLSEAEHVAMLGGQRVELTDQEFALLQALMEKPETALSREHLLREAWGYQSMGETRTVDVHVQRLRRKLGDERIETVYRCGYRLKMA